MNAPIESGAYLRSYLAPFARYLAEPDTTDLLVQRPGELWVEGAAGMVRHQVPAISGRLVEQLARQVAAANHQAVSRSQPLLSARLPGGERLQIVLPPAARDFPVLAIRRPLAKDLSLAELAAGGLFEAVAPGAAPVAKPQAALVDPDVGDDVGVLLAAAVRARCNIVIAGSTGSGKTTLLNALLKEIASEERLVAIEDTPELRLDRPNAVGLLAAKGETGEARVTVDDLLQASLRLRPDRLLVGELRGPEAYSFLRAVNTGHPGSITTVHADSAAGAREQIALMVLQAGTTLRREEILAYIEGVVDLFVQVARIEGRRRVVEVSRARR